MTTLLALLATQIPFHPLPTDPIVLPQYLDVPVEVVANGRFENGSSPWAADGNIDDPVYGLLGHSGQITGLGYHSGKRSFDFMISPHSVAYYSEVSQVFPSTMPGNKVFEASVWARWTNGDIPAGFAIDLLYTDGTTTSAYGSVESSYGYPAAYTDGWEKIDFLDAIDKTRTLKGIRIRTDSAWYYGSGIQIDDVHIGATVRVRIR